jgi:hypothetical protein
MRMPCASPLLPVVSIAVSGVFMPAPRGSAASASFSHPPRINYGPHRRRSSTHCVQRIRDASQANAPADPGRDIDFPVSN